MDAVDPLAIIGTTLVDPTGKHAARIVSLIGSGSFAHVYLAEDALHSSTSPTTPHPNSSRPSSPDSHHPSFSTDATANPMGEMMNHVGNPSTTVSPKRAVKRLFKKGLDPRQLMLQRQEAAVMKALDGHNNIVRLLATVEDEECLYLIMEYCELDLYEAITQQGGFPEDVVKEVFGQIADAVLYCHSKGYYHRDLKPENCLISTSDYKIKLADFGLATTDTWSTEMGCGSVRYMAPECFEAGHNQTDPKLHSGEVVGYNPAANDVWALGVILLNLLFGKNPWFEAFPTDAIFSAFSGSNPNILRQQFDLSPHFDGALRRCFDLDPRRRCSVADLKAMIEALPRFVGGGAIPNVVPVPNLSAVIHAAVGPPGCYGLVLPPGVPIPTGYPSPPPSRRVKQGSRPVSVATTVNSSNNGTHRLSVMSWERSMGGEEEVISPGFGGSAAGSRRTSVESVGVATGAVANAITSTPTAITAEESERPEKLSVRSGAGATPDRRRISIGSNASPGIRRRSRFQEEEEDDEEGRRDSMRRRMHYEHAERMLGEDEESLGAESTGLRRRISGASSTFSGGLVHGNHASHGAASSVHHGVTTAASAGSPSPATENGSVIYKDDATLPSGVYRFDPRHLQSEGVPRSSLSTVGGSLGRNKRRGAGRGVWGDDEAEPEGEVVPDNSTRVEGTSVETSAGAVVPTVATNGIVTSAASTVMVPGTVARDSGYDSGEAAAAAAARNLLTTTSGNISGSGSVSTATTATNVNTITPNGSAASSPHPRKLGPTSVLTRRRAASDSTAPTSTTTGLAAEEEEGAPTLGNGRRRGGRGGFSLRRTSHRNLKKEAEDERLVEKSGAIVVGRDDAIEADVKKALDRFSAEDEETGAVAKEASNPIGATSGPGPLRGGSMRRRGFLLASSPSFEKLKSSFQHFAAGQHPSQQSPTPPTTPPPEPSPLPPPGDDVPLPPPTTTSSRRSPSPRNWFSPLMTRETVVPGGVSPKNGGRGPALGGLRFGKRGEEEKHAQNATNGASSSSSQSQHNGFGGLIGFPGMRRRQPQNGGGGGGRNMAGGRKSPRPALGTMEQKAQFPPLMLDAEDESTTVVVGAARAAEDETADVGRAARSWSRPGITKKGSVMSLGNLVRNVKERVGGRRGSLESGSSGSGGAETKEKTSGEKERGMPRRSGSLSFLRGKKSSHGLGSAGIVTEGEGRSIRSASPAVGGTTTASAGTAASGGAGFSSLPYQHPNEGEDLDAPEDHLLPPEGTVTPYDVEMKSEARGSLGRLRRSTSTSDRIWGGSLGRRAQRMVQRSIESLGGRASGSSGGEQAVEDGAPVTGTGGVGVLGGVGGAGGAGGRRKKQRPHSVAMGGVGVAVGVAVGVVVVPPAV
ncbi:hypothetical protein HDU97_009310 [Phlyctochytrium planicorne]|nr:hypothetical protein HDU97_009310 [Phlyctochytrium planicorne]